MSIVDQRSRSERADSGADVDSWPAESPDDALLRRGSAGDAFLPGTDRPLPRRAGPWWDLARDAMATRRRLLVDDPAARPATWSRPAFLREVELVRTHLRVLRTRRALAASYGREAFHGGTTADDDPGPVAVAYAVRWLELGDGLGRPAFEVLLADAAAVAAP